MPAPIDRATLRPALARSAPIFSALQLRVEHWIFDLPQAVGGRALRLLAAPLRYLYALLRDLARGDLGLRAMSLVYSTLFAIVPVIAVAFAVLQAFGFQRELEPVLYELLRPLGDQGQRVAARIMDFVGNVQGTLVGTVGVAFLLYTAVTTVQKVEEAFNFTWHVERPRSLARRATEYLLVLLVVPALAVVSMVLLASVEARAVSAALSGGVETRTHLAPYATIVGLFAFLYVYMPNTRVRLWPAAIGALFGGLLWASMGAAFTRIVVYSAQLSAMYAGLAVLFLFLFWLYLSWLMLLLGAQLSFYVQHPEYLRTGHADIPMSGALRERVAMSAMVLIGRRHLRHEPRWTVNALAERMGLPATVLSQVVTALEAHGLVVTAGDETLVPARELDQVPLASVLEAIRHDVPDPRRPRPRPVRSAEDAVQAAEASMRASLDGRTLRDLAEGPD